MNYVLISVAHSFLIHAFEFHVESNWPCFFKYLLFRIKEEIEAMKSERNGEYREEKNNTDKYLALTLPPRHNEGRL